MKRWQEVMPEEDRAVFEKAGYTQPRPLGQNPALLIIDVTYGFIGTKPENVLKSIDEFRTSCGEVGWLALPHIKRLLDVCREKGLPVIYTRSNPPLFEFVGVPTKSAVATGSLEWDPRFNEIPDIIAPQPNEMILEKSFASAFFGTVLTTYLRRQGVDSVLVTGCVTSGCVRATVVDAHSHGLTVFVVEEGVFDRGQLSHLVSLYDMNAKYADVITVDEAIERVVELIRIE